MRIVIGSTQSGWRGGEEQARLLALGARDSGHEVLILGRARASFVARMEELGFPARGFFGRGRNPVALWTIRQALRRFRPDVLYYNDPHFVTCGGLASTGLGIPCRVAVKRTSFPMSSVARYRAFCDQIICVSTAVERICRAAGLPSEQLAVVADGVDPRRVQAGDRSRGRASLGLDPDQLLVLNVASLTDEKGHAYLIDAFEQVAGRETAAVLALAGEGPREADLRRRVERHGLGDRVRFLGHRDDVPDLMQACDVLAVASIMEGLCSSIIDAMFAERAIVTTTAGGIPDLVHPEGGQPVAWCVPPRSAVELAAALESALSGARERQRRAGRARRRAERHFPAARMVAATLAVFRRILSNGRQAAA